MSNKTGPCKVLIAFGARGTAIILATDNYWLAEEMGNVSDRAEDVGVECDGNEEPGLYLFEGEGAWHTYVDFEGCKDSTLEFDGTTRVVRLDELPALLAMKPPDRDPDAPAED